VGRRFQRLNTEGPEKYLQEEFNDYQIFKNVVGKNPYSESADGFNG
jgi:hypothetical protein